MKTKFIIYFFLISSYSFAQNVDISNGKVSVNSSAGTSGVIYGESDDLIIKAKTSSSLLPTTPGNIIFQTNSATGIVTFSTGNIGIGTASPTSKLHVNGESRLDRTSSETNPNLLLNGLSNRAFLNWTSNLVTKKWTTNSYLTSTDASNYLSVDYNNGTTTNTLLRFYGSGYIGIGTNTPSALLHISGLDNTGTDAPLKITDKTYTQNMFLDGNEIDTDTDMYLNYNTDKNIILVSKVGGVGNVGIGTNSPNNKLDVKGTIRSYEVIVESGWADYVFEDEYKLPSLKSIEKYIQENKHLPDVPAAKEIQENGAHLSDLVTKMMAKIEELTLYIIQQQKEIDVLKESVNNNSAH